MRSEICTYDLASGQVDVVLDYDGHMEAPNWTLDGAALIINGGGRLFRLDLADPVPVEIDSGFAVKCNNDHGISPDGQTLVISDSTEEGSSCIYTFPMGGGEPVRITKDVPSYWHGWSPDGATLAFVGKREEGVFALFTIPVTGGDEVQVTHGFDHVDGPDYSADGAWIWFNGEVDGDVSLWRIRPDGTGAEKMVESETVDWFPHPSPDGKHVAYLAYPAGTRGHPGSLNVELRLMPADGGETRGLVKLFGGQGTINVPSWAPDSSKFAFVRYAG